MISERQPALAGKATGLTPADLFNGYVGAQVIFALHELGVMEWIADDRMSIESLARRTQAQPDKLSALLDAAARLGYLYILDGQVGLTDAGRAAITERGYLTWVVGGGGEMLLRLADLTTGRLRFGVDVKRDDRQVAIGSAEVDQSVMRPIEEEALAGLSFTSVADIGCGSGARLVRLCQRPGVVRGVGIEISAGAAQLAAKNVVEAGLSDHVSILHADVLDCPASGHTFPGIELVTSFLMLHDLLGTGPDDGTAMRSLRQTFPDATHFLIADTVRQPWHELSGPPPIFSVAFELLHSYMGVKIHALERYESAFAQAGLTITRRVPFGAPSTWLYLLQAV